MNRFDQTVEDQAAWDLDNAPMETDLICGDCGGGLELLDEVFLLQVVVPGYDEHGRQEAFIIQDQEDGDYEYEPWFFHLPCWEALWDNFEEVSRMPPQPRANGGGLVECSRCQACIHEGETCGLLSLGELRRSRRQPNGEGTIYFDACNHIPKAICVACLFLFNNELITLWDDVTHDGACEQGIFARCWREGFCKTSCCLDDEAAE